MKRRDLSTVTVEDIERRMVIALRKMTPREGDIFLSVRFDTKPHAGPAGHAATVRQAAKLR